VHFANDGCTAGFDAVEVKHGDDVVCHDAVDVDDVGVFAHGDEVGAFGHDHGFFVERVGVYGGGNAGDDVDGGEVGGGFDVVEHEELGGGGGELECDFAEGALAVVEDKVGYVGVLVSDAVFADV
jgi:hypothetical protein